MTITKRATAALALAAGALSATPVYATASTPAAEPGGRTAAALSVSDSDCPDLTFCVRDASGNYAHYRNGSDNVLAQGLQGPAVWGWNRTQDTWCIYKETNESGTDAKVPAGASGGTGFRFLSLGPAFGPFC